MNEPQRSTGNGKRPREDQPRDVPPHDSGDEEVVVSSVLLTREAFDEVAEFLKPEHFYSAALRRIYSTVCELYRSQTVVDVISVISYAKDRGRLEEVGGTPYFAHLTDEIPYVLKVEPHARRIVEKWRLRQVIAVCQRVVAEGYGDCGDTQTFIERAGQKLTELATTQVTKKIGRTMSNVVCDWRNEGKVVRIPTGISSLDDACGGGLPLPRRILIIGAPSAGKTFTEIVLADMFSTRFAAMGFHVGIMAIDESDLDIGSRLAQMHGFSRDEIESRDAAILDDIDRMLGSSKIRFYDSEWTIEAAVDDLKSWAKPSNAPMVLCVDSLHTVRSIGSDAARNRKEFVDANCDALKRANVTDRITIIATGEMARSQYASEQFSNDSNAIAACADSRGPEFMAEVLFKLTSPKGIDDVVCVEMPKNRGGQRNVKFWLRLNFKCHTLTETGNPNEDPVVVEQRETEKHTKAEKKQVAFAETLAAFILKHPHLPKRQLIALAKVEFHCGQGTVENGLTVLSAGKTRYRLLETKKGTGKTATTHFDVELTGPEPTEGTDD